LPGEQPRQRYTGVVGANVCPLSLFRHHHDWQASGALHENRRILRADDDFQQHSPVEIDVAGSRKLPRRGVRDRQK
jgi:hypothetical protein